MLDKVIGRLNEYTDSDGTVDKVRKRVRKRKFRDRAQKKEAANAQRKANRSSRPERQTRRRADAAQVREKMAEFRDRPEVKAMREAITKKFAQAGMSGGPLGLIAGMIGKNSDVASMFGKLSEKIKSRPRKERSSE